MENQQCYIEIDGQQIPDTEEIFGADIRTGWSEHKHQNREKRRCNEKGNHCTQGYGLFSSWSLTRYLLSPAIRNNVKEMPL